MTLVLNCICTKREECVLIYIGGGETYLLGTSYCSTFLPCIVVIDFIDIILTITKAVS